MNKTCRSRRLGARLLLAPLVLALAAPFDSPAGQTPGVQASPEWPQWGGPDRDFRAPADGLAPSWPAGGPEELWRRELGDGYSAILYKERRLYTMYGSGDRETVVSLDAETGKTIWEYSYERTPYEGLGHYGSGPRSTPLIAGDLLFTIGITGNMHALDLGDGRVVWSHDLWGDGFGGNSLQHGYSSSPVAYGDTVIVPVGGESASLVALDQSTGSVVWRAQSFRNSYSSPLIAEIAGERQLVAFMADEAVGIDPETGELRWRYPHSNQWSHNIHVPAVVGGDTLFLSSPQAGAKGLRFVRDDDALRVDVAWSSRRIQLYHTSSVQSGDWLYGSIGVTAPAFMAAVNVRTGEIAWRERGFAKANCLEADGQLVILDEDGVLYLATATPEELVVHARTELLDRVSWTVPTLVGKTLYVRDRRQILAVDLG